MEATLHVESSHKTPPQALIPNEYKWDLVEYLALQRVHVVYTYCDGYFIVAFPHMDHAGVQRLLDEWLACTGPEIRHLNRQLAAALNN